jgi:hypothetical protein
MYTVKGFILASLVLLAPLAGAEEQTLEVPLSDVELGHCFIHWDYERGNEKDIDGFKLYHTDHQGGGAANVITLKKNGRRYACKFLDLEGEGLHSIHMVSYKGENESEPTSTFQFKTVAGVVTLVPPQKFRLIIRR